MSASVIQILVRIQCPENLRVPPQGLSIQGESRPKIFINVGIGFKLSLASSHQWTLDVYKGVRLFEKFLSLSVSKKFEFFRSLNFFNLIMNLLILYCTPVYTRCLSSLGCLLPNVADIHPACTCFQVESHDVILVIISYSNKILLNKYVNN